MSMGPWRRWAPFESTPTHPLHQSYNVYGTVAQVGTLLIHPHPPLAPELYLGEDADVTMQPWCKGFKGTIQEVPSKTAGKSYNVYETVVQVLSAQLINGCASTC